MYKEYEEVNVGDSGEDYDGNKLWVLEKGYVKELDISKQDFINEDLDRPGVEVTDVDPDEADDMDEYEYQAFHRYVLVYGADGFQAYSEQPPIKDEMVNMICTSF